MQSNPFNIKAAATRVPRPASSPPPIGRFPFAVHRAALVAAPATSFRLPNILPAFGNAANISPANSAPSPQPKRRPRAQLFHYPLRLCLRYVSPSGWASIHLACASASQTRLRNLRDLSGSFSVRIIHAPGTDEGFLKNKIVLGTG